MPILRAACPLPRPMLTLGIETATDVCAVALLSGGDLVFEAAVHLPRQHGRRLAPLVDEALAHAGHGPDALGLVAVSAGPGSYTGLRIGTATAKGLCLATGAAFVAVPTLLALADGARPFGPPGAVVAVLPSRRGEVYAAAYRLDGDVLAEVRPAAALALTDAAGWLPDGPLAAVGAGADRLLGAAPDRDWRPLPVAASAARVARLGQERVAAQGVDDLAASEPLYLKPVAATRPRGILGG